MFGMRRSDEVKFVSKAKRIFVLLALVMLSLSSCLSDEAGVQRGAAAPAIPEKLTVGEDGVPSLRVYDVSADEVEEMPLETYVMGVVAGEMKNDWPIEALKAQAILARTFVLKFCDTKSSMYDGADISTDVREAQAYAPENINDRVRQAVEETTGTVLSADGEYPYAWFFAHAGGTTELPSVALDYDEADPGYLSVVESPDSDDAPADVKQWTVRFSEEEVRTAAAGAGLKVDAVESVAVGERGQSGRAKTLLINGSAVSAPSFRIQIGADRLKSTLIDAIDVDDAGNVTFSGRGYGHGVGMSQWGAYALAEQGHSAEEIVEHYFTGVDVVKLY